jgi:pimeloyl-ACP methyl ester carboxylesterase
MKRRALRRLTAVGLIALLMLGAIYALRPDWILRAEFGRQAVLAGLSKHELDAGGHRIVYYDGGGGGVPLVLLHGFTGSKENWLESARYLTPHFRVIAPDLPGWGESEHRDDQGYQISEQAQRVAEFLDALHLPQVHLVGHSMGGHIAGMFAVRYPERLKSLTLVDSAGLHFRENDFARRVIAGATPFNFSDRAQFDAFMHELFAAPRWLPPRLKDVLIARNVAGHAFHAQLLRQFATEPQAFLLEHHLDEITAPTFVVWCRDDRLIDASAVEVLIPGLRHARRMDVALLDDCSHMPMMEHPREFASRLLGFFGQ